MSLERIRNTTETRLIGVLRVFWSCRRAYPFWSRCTAACFLSLRFRHQEPVCNYVKFHTLQVAGLDFRTPSANVKLGV